MPRTRRQLDPEWSAAGLGAALAVVGWIVGGRYFAVTGVLIVFTALLLWVWGRESLTGVTYVRTVARRRATFGETVTVEIELVNDKLLPLTWLHVRERVPASLPLDGAPVLAAGWRTEVQLVVAMLPYQRVRRRLTVHCDERGEHLFGPAELRSGSPLGTREQTRELRNETSLLVYPKVVPLSAPLAVARVPLPDRRARHSLSPDPTRVVGVRSYLPGDPVRHVDWRASARHGDLLVRVHEPATTLGTAVFVDLLPPARVSTARGDDITEHLVSVAASVVSHLVGAGVPTGLFANGTSRTRLVAVPTSAAGSSLPTMLEALARVSTAGAVPLEHVLLEHGPRLGTGTSALVVSADFSEEARVVIAGLRRRTTVRAIWLATDRGRPPAPGTVDACFEVHHDPDWRTGDVLELT